MYTLKKYSFLTLSLVLAFSFLVYGHADAQTNRESILIDGDITKTFSLKANGQFSANNINGSIEIESWNKNEVEIKLIERRRGDDELEVEFDTSPDRVIVSVYKERRSRYRYNNRRSTTVNMEIKVPRDVKIDAETVNGHVNIREISGNVDAQTTNGRIRLSTITGDVEANTTNGHVDLEMINGEINSRTTNAPIIVRDSKSSRMYLNTTNGGIRADFDLDSSGSYDLSTTNGDVEIRIAENSKVDLDIVVKERDFDTDFESLKEYETRTRRDRDSRSSRSRYDRYDRWDRQMRIREELNGGGARLRLRTTNGQISLRSK